MEILKVVLTSLISIIALFIAAKIMGHKEISQLDFFDYITGITIGSVAAELATELEAPLRPLIAIFIYAAVSVILRLITSKMPKMRHYINGSPTIIMKDGNLYRKNMKKAKLDLSEFMVMCRQLGYFDLNDIQTAIFEFNGKLTILPVSNKRPATPYDMDIKTPKEDICVEIIMDGRIMHSNLKRLGVDIDWLEKQLNSKGYDSAKQIFLGVCDIDKKVTLFPVK